MIKSLTFIEFDNIFVSIKASSYKCNSAITAIFANFI